MKLTVGIPREIKKLEMRVALTPEGARQLRGHGIPVVVETRAGELSGFTDGDYLKAGAGIVSNAEVLYARASLIQKVKEPQLREFSLLRKEHILFSFLHLASPENEDVVSALLKSGCTAIGYETVEIQGDCPILKPMSAIAGGLASSYAAYLESVDRGKLQSFSITEGLKGVAGFYPEAPLGLKLDSVVIWGGGVAGESAARTAVSLGAKVTVIEVRQARAQQLRESLGKSVDIVAPNGTIETLLEKSKVFIGCVHKTGERAFHVMTPEDLKRFSRVQKKIIMDVSIDQGGNFPMARATTYEEPIYLDDFGNVRFAVANIPSFCGPAASQALADVVVPYTEAMALNFLDALKNIPELSRAINVKQGKILHSHILKVR